MLTQTPQVQTVGCSWLWLSEKLIKPFLCMRVVLVLVLVRVLELTGAVH